MCTIFVWRVGRRLQRSGRGQLSRRGRYRKVRRRLLHLRLRRRRATRNRQKRDPRSTSDSCPTKFAARYSVSAYRPSQGDSDVISMPAGFRRHLVGEPPINDFHCGIVVELVIIQTFSYTNALNVI